MIRELRHVALALLLAGCTCNKIEEPPPTQANLAPTPQSAKPPTPEPEPPVDVASLPVEEDYELEAEKVITPKTLIDEVNELDEEVSAK